MKKSKLVVPAALAVMLLSTAASVTGTVAWFTANRSVHTQVSSFKVNSVDGNLVLTNTAGIGTSVANNVVSVDTTNATMTDGSVNHADGTVFRQGYKSTDTNKIVVSPTSENYYRTVGSNKYYFAVQWNMRFTYTFAGDQTATNLYFDTDTALSKLTVTVGTAQGSATTYYETHKAFRIAFVYDSANSSDGVGSTKVWAPNQTEANCKYITAATNDLTGTAYSTGLIASNTTGALLKSAEYGGSSVSNYLGQFTYNANAASYIQFKCYAWFEGTDPNIKTADVNAGELTSMDTVTADMEFFVRPNQNQG